MSRLPPVNGRPSSLLLELKANKHFFHSGTYRKCRRECLHCFKRRFENVDQWAPGSNTLWTSVNERDELSDDMPVDYLTSVQEGGFYGWPYAYWGQNEDPRFKGQRPDLVQKSIKPDVSLGPHTSSLGLVFYTKENFQEKYRGGAFVGQHGSWNRSKFSGYKVVFVPFANGKPTGNAEDFLTGFIASEEKSEVYGRPVGVAVAADGSLLVADDNTTLSLSILLQLKDD